MDAQATANFPFLTGNTFFGLKFGQKIIKTVIIGCEIWYLDWFEYTESNGDVHFFRFWLKIPFLGKICPKINIVSSAKIRYLDWF